MVKPLCRTRWCVAPLLVLLLTVVVWGTARWVSEQAVETSDRPAGRTAHQAQINEAYGRMPLHFEANHGQTDGRVAFVTRSRGYTMFLTENEAVLTLNRPDAANGKGRRLQSDIVETPRPVEHSVLRMTYAGANRTPRIVGQDELPGKVNYFKGNDPSKWRTNVPTYARVRYEELYPGIDLVYYGNRRALEYDFVVKPGADPARIALGFQGVSRMEIDAQGDLLLQTSHGTIRQSKPLIYQEVDGVRREIAGGYLLDAEHRAAFEVAAYDTSRALVIDPTLFYSTFLGGSGDDTANGIALDSSGDAYVTGGTTSVDLPTAAPPMQSPFQSALDGSTDAYVTKLNATGSALVYSTYVGGAGGDGARDIAVDSAGNAYIVGATDSSGFPTTAGAFDTTFNGVADLFVTKLDSTGSMLVYSTYLGGTGFDIGTGIALDFAGNAYVAGHSLSTDFPTTVGAFQTTLAGDADLFVTKLSLTGAALVYSTYLGGTVSEQIGGIAVDAAGSAYVTGNTNSPDYPTTAGSFQPVFSGGTIDALVTKLNLTGSGLVYSTYLGGGPDNDGGSDIAVDAAGSAYVTGFTNSLNFPTTLGAFDTTYNADPTDAFVTKLDFAGSALVYSTYLGGDDVEEGIGIAIDATGNAFLIGRTASSDFPLDPGAFQTTFAGAEDAFVTKLNAAGSGIVYSTYFGGSSFDTNLLDIALDSFPEPNAYVVGGTSSTDFPFTMGAFDEDYNGGAVDAFVAQIVDVVLPPGPTAGRVRGQGTIAVPGGVGRFHLLVRRQTDGTVRGRVQYRNHVTDAKMKSETITSLIITTNTARIDGTCGTACTFTVNVSDVDDTGTNDTFTISVNGGPTEGGTLQKGNIQIQQ